MPNPKSFVMSFRLIVSLAFLSVHLLGNSTDLSDVGPMRVQSLEFAGLVDKARGDRRVPVKVHYPDATGPFPVIVVSHGAGGNWDTHLAQIRHLVSHGYVALSVEHVGSNSEKLRQTGISLRSVTQMIYDAGEVIARPVDIHFVIDQAQEWNRGDATLKGRMKLGNLGMLGHSFGAYTTMVIGGMRPALDWIRPILGSGKGLGPDLRDGRVRCGVALSPQGANEPFFHEESFASLRMPLMGISGTLDRQQNELPAETRYQAFDYWPTAQGQHRFVWLANAKHLDFTDSSGSGQIAPPSPTRADVQPLVKAATLMYFDACLRDDRSALAALNAEGLRPYLRGAVNSVEVKSK